MTTLSKPYHRLWRPMKGFNNQLERYLHNNTTPSIDYLKEDSFADQTEKMSQIISAHLILKDLYEIFNYVEPCNGNKNVYSHRIYELLLRACTEVESNMKGILTANGIPSNTKFTMKNNYFQLGNACQLDKYKIKFKRWKEDVDFNPFSQWNSTSYSTLTWYKEYNDVKHDRYKDFKKANLENLMNSIAALLCLLHAQYGEDMADACQLGISAMQNNQLMVDTDTFVLEAPDFAGDEYEFDWDSIKSGLNPVDNYIF